MIYRRTGFAAALFASLLIAAPAAQAADGDLVPAFAGDGTLRDDYGTGVTSYVYGAAVQPDGKLVVVGEANSEGVIARFLTNGSFDPAFGGGDGIVVIDSGTTSGGERLRAVAIQPDNKIVALGEASLDGGDADFVLARVDSTGSPDGGFDGTETTQDDGVFRINPGAGFANSGDIATSGTKIVFGGSISFHSRVYQLNDNGTLDTAGFNSPNGFLAFDFPCGFCSGESFFGALAVQSDGKIVAVGKGNNTAASLGVARITTSGTLDTATFASPNGMVALTPPSGYFGGFGEDVIVDSSGNIRIGTSLTDDTSPFPQDAGIAAVTSSGALDTGFGGGTGYAILPDMGNEDSVTGIARQPDGALLLGGSGGNGAMADLFSARFTSGGVLDTTYAAPNGVRTVDIDGLDVFGSAFELSPTGVAYATGNFDGVSPVEFGIAAFATDTPDPPQLTGTNPPSPANNNGPAVLGSAQAGSTVDLWANGTCADAPVLEDRPAANLGSPGLTVSVADNSVTTFSAKATNASGTSACSTVNTTYSEVTPPPGPPTLTGTNPASGSNDNSPRVLGAGEAGTTIDLYANGTCSGTPVLEDQPQANLFSPGLLVTVADNSNTSFSATQTGPGGMTAGTSACSNAITYNEVTPAPPTPPGPGIGGAAAPKCKKGFKLVKGKCKKKKRKKKK
jgi:uncharacterized delta-60 repeat protein